MKTKANTPAIGTFGIDWNNIELTNSYEAGRNLIEMESRGGNRLSCHRGRSAEGSQVHRCTNFVSLKTKLKTEKP